MHDNQSTEAFPGTSTHPAPVEPATGNPLVTIILPVYNVAKWLDTCMQSIVKQTYANLQIILIDDGSTDESPAICEHWAAEDSRINVVHQQNAGLSAARNTGLQLRKGEYVCFVDSDDYVEPDYVERMLDTALTEQADMVVCNIRKEDEDGNPVKEPDPAFEAKTFTYRQYMADALQSNWKHTVAWNKLYRSSIWDDFGYPVGKIHEDEFVIAQIIARCSRIVCIDDALYHYIQRGGSIMTKKYSIRNLDRIEALCERFRFLKSHGFENCLPTTIDNILWTFIIAQPQLRDDPPAWRRLQSLSAQSRTLCRACLAQPMSTAKRAKILFAALFSPLTFARIRNRLRH